MGASFVIGESKAMGSIYDGLIERVVRGDLARHYDISSALHEMSGQVAYMPARRAVVAKKRKQS